MTQDNAGYPTNTQLFKAWMVASARAIATIDGPSNPKSAQDFLLGLRAAAQTAADEGRVDEATGEVLQGWTFQLEYLLNHPGFVPPDSRPGLPR